METLKQKAIRLLKAAFLIKEPFNIEAPPPYMYAVSVFNVEKLVELALAEEREANGWISVKDRLPEWAGRDDTPCEVNGEKIGAILTSEKVLVVIAPNNTVRIDHLTSIENSNDEHQYEWFYMYKDRVTHWMALPAAPKDEVSKDA